MRAGIGHWRAAALVLAALALGGCAEGGVAGTLRAAGVVSKPDEFLVLPTRPLEMPQNLTALPPPTPGTLNRVDYHPRAEAIAGLTGRPQAPAASGAALVARAGPVDPSVRAAAGRRGRRRGAPDTPRPAARAPVQPRPRGADLPADARSTPRPSSSGCARGACRCRRRRPTLLERALSRITPACPSVAPAPWRDSARHRPLGGRAMRLRLAALILALPPLAAPAAAPMPGVSSFTLANGLDRRGDRGPPRAGRDPHGLVQGRLRRRARRASRASRISSST